RVGPLGSVPDSDDMAVPKENGGFAIFDRLALQLSGAGNHEQLIAKDLDLGKLVAVHRVLDREPVEVVARLKRLHLVRRRIGDPDPHELRLVARLVALFVDGDTAHTRSVAVEK